MDEILKSEIFLAVYERKHGVSFEEFGGVFRQVHGYYLNLSHYGYSSLRKLLNDMNDLVEIKFIKGQNIIRCKSPTRHHVVVSDGNNSLQENEPVSGLSSIHPPSAGPSQGPVVKKTKQTQSTHVQQNQVKVNSTSSAASKISKEPPKPKCPTPAKKTDPAVRPKNSSKPIKCGLNEKTATINKTKKRHKPASPKVFKPVHAKPAGNVATASGAVRTNNASKTGQKNNSNSSNGKSKTNLTTLQNNNSTKTSSTAYQALSAPGAQNKKAGLLPTPKAPLKGNLFNTNYVLPIPVQPGISYASVLANNRNNSNFNHSGQQHNSNNIRFNVESGTRVNSIKVEHSHSRADSRNPIQSISVIKENIQDLLTQHADGLSVFQLQKKYLFTFQQPLKFRGSSTLKQFLMELKDVLRTDGVGVQMLVFPVSANKTADSNGEHGAALQVAGPLSTKKYFQREVVLNPHSSDPLRSSSDELREPAQLCLQNGQHQMDHTEEQIKKVVKTENKQLRLQNIQKVKHLVSSEHHVESPKEERSGPAQDARVLHKQINEEPQHTASQSVQLPCQIYKSHDREEMSDVCKNVIMKDAPRTNRHSQSAPQDSNFSRVILHSSGFSFLMGQGIAEPQNTERGINLSEAGSLTEQEKPQHSNNLLKGTEHSQQILPTANSHILLQDTKPHHLSNFHVENTEHLLLQPQNPVNTMKTNVQTESSVLQSMRDLLQITANNGNVTKSPTLRSTDIPQTKTVPTQKGKPSSVQENTSQIRIDEQAAYLSSNSQENTLDSQIINKKIISLSASSNEKESDAQNTNINEKTLQPEASVSLPKNDLVKANTHDLYVHDTKQGAHLSSDADKVVNINTSNGKQNKSTLETKQFDTCTTAEIIAWATLSPSKPRQEIVDPPQNIPNHLDSSVAQSELQNNLESIREQEGMAKTWQTSQEQVCCIL